MTRSAPARQIPIETLHELLVCDAEAGKLYWRERGPEWFEGSRNVEGACRSWNTRYAGASALMSLSANGYRRGAVLDKTLLAHRVIWAMHNRAWPAECIDHVNGDRLDNRISNLREATLSENKANAGRRSKANRFIGVRPVAGCATFIATVGHQGRNVYVGSYRSEVAAARARDRAAVRLKGDFARLNFPEEANR